jgi:hypothetical protein
LRKTLDFAKDNLSDESGLSLIKQFGKLGFISSDEE